MIMAGPRLQLKGRLIAADYLSTSRNGNPRWTFVLESDDGSVSGGLKTGVDSASGYEMQNLENERHRHGGGLPVHVRGDSVGAIWDVHRDPNETGAPWFGCNLCEEWKAEPNTILNGERSGVQA